MSAHQLQGKSKNKVLSGGLDAAVGSLGEGSEGISFITSCFPAKPFRGYKVMHINVPDVVLT